MPMPRSLPFRCEALRRLEKPFQSESRLRLFQNLPEFAAVVDRPVRRLVGHRRRRDEIAPTQRRAIDIHRLRRLVDQAFDQIDRLRPTGPAIRSERRRIGQHHLHADVDRRNDVDAGEAVLGVGGRDDRGERRGVGADPDIGARTQAEEFSTGVQRKLGLQHAVASMGVGEKALKPGRAPFHRPADAARCVQQGGVVGIGLHLHSKAAAHVVREDANLARRNLEDAFGKDLSDHGHALRRRDQRVAPALRIEARDGGARLHRARRQARVDQPHPLDMRSARERGIDRCHIAVLPVERNIARRAPPDRRRVLRHCALHVRRSGQRIELDLDRFGGVARLIRRLRDHDGDRLTDVAYALRGQHRHRGLKHRLAVAPIEGSNRRNVADVVRREIAARDRGDDARHLDRRRGVHLTNDRMRDSRPHERCVHLAGNVQIVGELSATGEEGCVLAADSTVPAAEPKACPVGLLRFVSLRAHGCVDPPRGCQAYASASICKPRAPPCQACDHSASAGLFGSPGHVLALI